MIQSDTTFTINKTTIVSFLGGYNGGIDGGNIIVSDSLFNIVVLKLTMMTDEECAICMSSPPVYDSRITCSHNNLFCTKCIDDCIQHKIYECPLCKNKMNTPTQVVDENQLQISIPPNTVVIARVRRNLSSDTLARFYQVCLFIYIFYVCGAIMKGAYLGFVHYASFP